MKLNPDCIRSVMLCLEKELVIDDDLKRVMIDIDKLFELLPKYLPQDILYSVEKLNEAGYIKASMQFASGSFVEGKVSSITYTGHEYIENVRDSKIWQKVKEIISKMGSASLSIIFETAKSVVMQGIGEMLR